MAVTNPHLLSPTPAEVLRMAELLTNLMRLRVMRDMMLAGFLCVLAAAANSSEIVRISPDTYVLARNSHAGIFANMSKLKMATIREANAFAESQGKIAIPISTREMPAGGPGQWPTVEYQFRVVSKDDPEAQRTALVPRPDIVVESNSKINADVRTNEETQKPPDLYAELLKLDDLRKRGLLTDAEFDTQKRRLLEPRE
jgi:hypothetical protein